MASARNSFSASSSLLLPSLLSPTNSSFTTASAEIVVGEEQVVSHSPTSLSSLPSPNSPISPDPSSVSTSPDTPPPSSMSPSTSISPSTSVSPTTSMTPTTSGTTSSATSRSSSSSPPSSSPSPSSPSQTQFPQPETRYRCPSSLLLAEVPPKPKNSPIPEPYFQTNTNSKNSIDNPHHRHNSNPHLSSSSSITVKEVMKPTIMPHETVNGLINGYYEHHDEEDPCTFYTSPEPLSFARVKEEQVQEMIQASQNEQVNQQDQNQDQYCHHHDSQYPQYSQYSQIFQTPEQIQAQAQEKQPIYYPNEILLEKITNKMAVKRLSEIRVADSRIKADWLTEKMAERKLKLGSSSSSSNRQARRNGHSGLASVSNDGDNNASSTNSNKDKDSKGKKRFNAFSRRLSNLGYGLSSSSSSSTPNSPSSSALTSSFSSPPKTTSSTSNNTSSSSNSSISTPDNNNNSLIRPSSHLLYSIASSITNVSADTLSTAPHFSSFFFAPTSRTSQIGFNDRESSHLYLSHGLSKGNIFVTTQRIIFLPIVRRNTSSLLPTLDNSEFHLNIGSIDTMKVIQSSRGKWFFVAYEDLFVLSIPFGSKNKAIHFLKLVSNMRFETMISRNLAPIYQFERGGINGVVGDGEASWSSVDVNASTTQESENIHAENVSEGLSNEHGSSNNGFSNDVGNSDSSNGANDNSNRPNSKSLCNCFYLQTLQIPTALCHSCCDLSTSSFLNSNSQLPSYKESEYALGLYLQHLNLISDACIYDRSDIDIDPEALVAVAAGPPAFDFLSGRFSKKNGVAFYSTSSNGSNGNGASTSVNINDNSSNGTNNNGGTSGSNTGSSNFGSFSSFGNFNNSSSLHLSLNNNHNGTVMTTLTIAGGPGVAVSSGYNNVPVLNPIVFATGGGGVSSSVGGRNVQVGSLYFMGAHGSSVGLGTSSSSGGGSSGGGGTTHRDYSDHVELLDNQSGNGGNAVNGVSSSSNAGLGNFGGYRSQRNLGNLLGHNNVHRSPGGLGGHPNRRAQPTHRSHGNHQSNYRTHSRGPSFGFSELDSGLSLVRSHG